SPARVTAGLGSRRNAPGVRTATAAPGRGVSVWPSGRMVARLAAVARAGGPALGGSALGGQALGGSALGGPAPNGPGPAPAGLRQFRSTSRPPARTRR